MDLTEARKLFPFADSCIYMNHAGLGPLPEPSRVAVVEMAARLSNPPTAITVWPAIIDRLHSSLATLVNASPENIAITRGTAHGLSLLAVGLDWRAGDNVVGVDREFPTNVYPWMALADRGVESRWVKPGGGRVDAEMIFRLVDDRTRVVALSHVEYWNGFRADLAAIGAECRRRGVIFSVDAIQSVGAVQVDVASMNIDHLSAGAYKWLLGPVGMGFAYIHPDLIERLRPPLVGWGTMVPTSSPSQYRVEFQHSAKRFEESIISLLDIAAFQASVDLILDLGPAAIEDRVLALSQRLSGGLASRGLEVVEPWPRSRTEASGIVSFRRSGTVAADLLAVLTAGGVEGRVHDDFVRLAPHFYNTEIEIDRVLELVS